MHADLAATFIARKSILHSFFRHVFFIQKAELALLMRLAVHNLLVLLKLHLPAENLERGTPNISPIW